MQQYLARRLLLFIPTLLLASLGIFAIMRVLPGDVAMMIIGGDESGPMAVDLLDKINEELGLADPLPVQYGKWAWSMVNGRFGGNSLLDGEPIATTISSRLPITLQLTVYTMVIAWIFSVPMGVLAAVYQNRWPDYVVRVVTLLGHAMPNFWVALILILVMLVFFSWTPPLFYTDVWEDPWNHIQKLIWPALVLAWGYSSYLTRVTRSSMLEVLRQDYVRTARSKGLAEQIVVYRHALRNAFIPVVTLGGLQLVSLLSGTVILESIFSIPGIGQAIVIAATQRDYPVIQSLTMLLVFMMLTLHIIVDVVYGIVDPRIKFA